jgi:hypothetical protein
MFLERPSPRFLYACLYQPSGDRPRWSEVYNLVIDWDGGKPVHRTHIQPETRQPGIGIGASRRHDCSPRARVDGAHVRDGFLHLAQVRLVQTDQSIQRQVSPSCLVSSIASLSVCGNAVVSTRPSSLTALSRGYLAKADPTRREGRDIAEDEH